MEFLKRTKEQKEAEKKRQDELRKKFNSRIRLSPAEQERVRALILEPDLRKQLKETVDKRTSQGRKDKTHLRARLADNLAKQGRFEEAADIHPDNTEAQFYAEVWKAVWRKTEILCQCSPEKVRLQGKLLTIPNFQVLKEIYSVKEGRNVPLLKCTCCGFLNARDLTPELRKLASAPPNTPDTELLT